MFYLHFVMNKFLQILCYIVLCSLIYYALEYFDFLNHCFIWLKLDIIIMELSAAWKYQKNHILFLIREKLNVHKSHTHTRLNYSFFLHIFWFRIVTSKILSKKGKILPFKNNSMTDFLKHKLIKRLSIIFWKETPCDCFILLKYLNFCVSRGKGTVNNPTFV